MTVVSGNKFVAAWRRVWSAVWFAAVILGGVVGAAPAPAVGQTLAPYPSIEIVEEPRTLVHFGTNWAMWADIDQPPPGWPLTEAPEERPITEVLAPDHPESTDQYIDYGGEFAPASGWQWTSVMTPVVGRSHATHESLSERWEREERRRIRRNREPPQRTNLLYTTGVGPTSGGMNAPAEPGLQNLYFVREFWVEDATQYQSLQLDAEFAGGLIVYLNGQEILRHHVAPNRDSFGDAATPFWLPDWVNQTTANRWERSWLGIDPGLLQSGDNVLAVVIHKRPSGGEKSFYFDVQLQAYDAAGMTKTPYLQSLDHESIVVRWETNVPSFGYVEFGPEGEEGFLRVAASPEVASTMHEIRLDGLRPSTRYLYRVHSYPVSFTPGERPREAFISDTRHFITSVEPGTPFTFVAYGDTRTQSDIHAAIIEQMWGDIQRTDARFVLHTGDLTTTGASWEQWQREFFRPALPLLGYIPFYTSLGNHEGNHEMYYRYMSLPGNEAWYSFTFGDVEFFALNSSFDYSTGSMQLTWLEEALGASSSPWKIVFFHHPPYACTPSRKPGDEEVQAYIVPLMEQYNVDMVVMGHDHLYGRSVELNGVYYVITGGGGAPQYPAEPDEINEVCVQEFHYCMIDVDEDSMTLRSIGLGGTELDRLVLHSDGSSEAGLR